MERFADKTVVITGAGDMAEVIGERILSGRWKRSPLRIFRKKRKAHDGCFEGEELCRREYSDCILQCEEPEGCDQVIAKTIERWGKVDALVATAGIIRHLPIDEMSEKDWQDVIDINLSGVFHACKAVVPSMKERRYGRIVLISSIGGRTGRNVGVNYAASKAGVNGIAINLAYTLAPWNITVNSVAPGPLKGRMFESMPKDRQESLAAAIPLKRLGELADAAAAVAYLASDDAAWTTGEVLDVNGGLQY